MSQSDLDKPLAAFYIILTQVRRGSIKILFLRIRIVGIRCFDFPVTIHELHHLSAPNDEDTRGPAQNIESPRDVSTNIFLGIYILDVKPKEITYYDIRDTASHALIKTVFYSNLGLL